MPVFLKICMLLINSSMRFVKNEFLTPQLAGLVTVKPYSLKVSPFKKGETFLEVVTPNPKTLTTNTLTIRNEYKLSKI